MVNQHIFVTLKRPSGIEYPTHQRHPATCLCASLSSPTSRSQCRPSRVQAVAKPSEISTASMLAPCWVYT